MNEPTLSIITVCYNSAATIRDTFESVLAQNYENYEYIIVDGGSTDQTVQIIKEYEPRFRGKMKWKSERDQGLYDAMNKGIRQSNGKFIGIINSDDWYENGVFDSVDQHIEDHPEIDLFYGIIRIVKDGKEYMIRRNNYEFISDFSGMIQHPTCFVKREVYEKYGSFDTRYRISADIDFVLRILHKGIRYHAIDKIITNFRVGGASDQHSNAKEILDIKYKNGVITKNQLVMLSYKQRIKAILSSARNALKRKLASN
ncbi:glycosyltransferase family 2 protein [Paenibacillus sedimenti]|uniref:Glycosyltransferase n=1 Tax=Paenibacillus sedimenti TaxID=2770274 RepID=A0A926KMA6_9BACL|nr:glycosyltransferase family 2 protein [Paenibacillus sedimenti]MBD0379743.1 glycosyltransferase [Paenibacillus sedimenti]